MAARPGWMRRQARVVVVGERGDAVSGHRHAVGAHASMRPTIRRRAPATATRSTPRRRADVPDGDADQRHRRIERRLHHQQWRRCTLPARLPTLAAPALPACRCLTARRCSARPPWLAATGRLDTTLAAGTYNNLKVTVDRPGRQRQHDRQRADHHRRHDGADGGCDGDGAERRHRHGRRLHHQCGVADGERDVHRRAGRWREDPGERRRHDLGGCDGRRQGRRGRRAG